MPLVAPPATANVSLHMRQFAAGTTLWRVHPADYAVTAFKDVPSDALFGGGRFDATSADRYPFLYAAPDLDTALLETLVRSVPFDDRGGRMLRRVGLANLRTSALRVTRDLTLVSLLTAADLAAACQDEWLIQADPRDYPQTRRWGSWLRGRAGTADGLVWMSRRNIPQPSVVLFGDRCDNAVAVTGEPAVALDTEDGIAWLNDRLAAYHIEVGPPGEPLPPSGT
jgi:hypothetical protein